MLASKVRLTKEDRKRWESMDNDSGRRAMKHLTSQTTKRLLSCVTFTKTGGFEDGGSEFVKFSEEFQRGTNLGWLSSQIAAELYSRGAIDEAALDHINSVN